MNRAEQTLRVIDLIRRTQDCPKSLWQILLILTLHPGPLGEAEIAERLRVTGCRPTLRKMVRLGLIKQQQPKNKKFYSITELGAAEAARIIEAKP